MKHVYALSFLIALCSTSNDMLAQPTSGYLFETLDQPYVPLTEATELSPADWDEEAGWDDPEFTVPLGFEFDLAGEAFSELTQYDLGATYFGGTVLEYYSSALVFLVGPDTDLADLGNLQNDSLGNSPIRWQTEGEPGEQVFTLEYVNAGMYDEVFSDNAADTYSSLNFQFRLFEATGVLEVHYGESYLTEETLNFLQQEQWSGWHGFIPGYDAAYYDGTLILTNINAEATFTDFSAGEQGIPFDGFSQEGRLFRYTPAVVGCHLETACNYDEAVNYPSPETCIFPDAPGLDCDGNCIEDADEDGVCDAIEGCTEGLACNYDPSATEDDGTCLLSEPGYDCSGECLNDVDADGICDVNEIPGCTDPDACNYDENATDLEFCDFPLPFYDCEEECLVDTDGDGVCDGLEQDGCTDPEACNYDFWATEDDGSCYDELPLTIVGDTLVSVGDTILVTVEGPVDDFYGTFSPTCNSGVFVLDVTNDTFTAIVDQSFDSCTMTYFTFDSGCTTNALTISIDTGSSAVGELKETIEVHPNPVASALTVTVPDGWASGVDVQMVNTLGQTVLSKRLAPGSHAIDVSDLSNGVHLLICGDRTKRILVQH